MRREFTLDERAEISRAYNAGNYANAYESTDLEAFSETLDEYSAHERAAFVLGFFSSYALHEIDIVTRQIFDQAYNSRAGRYVVRVAKYCDDRTAEYRAGSETL